jgi:hypothetical protein
MPPARRWRIPRQTGHLATGDGKRGPLAGGTRQTVPWRTRQTLPTSWLFRVLVPAGNAEPPWTLPRARNDKHVSPRLTVLDICARQIMPAGGVGRERTLRAKSGGILDKVRNRKASCAEKADSPGSPIRAEASGIGFTSTAQFSEPWRLTCAAHREPTELPGCACLGLLCCTPARSCLRDR